MDRACDFISIHAHWIGILSDIDTKISGHGQNDIRYPNKLDHDFYIRAISQ
jgi:hypothetical protein